MVRSVSIGMAIVGLGILSGCGGEPAEQELTLDSPVESGTDPEYGVTIPEGLRAKALESELWHLRGDDAVKWVRFESDALFVGVLDSRPANFDNDLYLDVAKVQKKITGDFSLWIVDGTNTTEEWTSEDAGLLSKASLPLKLDLEMLKNR